MNRWYILKDQNIIGSTATKEQALAYVRTYQEQETHPFLRASFSIMYGEQEFIDYPKYRRTRRAKQ